jgi:hypothetical protein
MISWIRSMRSQPSAQRLKIGNRGRLPKMSKMIANMLKMTDSSSRRRAKKKRRSPFRRRRKRTMISVSQMSTSPHRGISLHLSKTTSALWPSRES